MPRPGGWYQTPPDPDEFCSYPSGDCRCYVCAGIMHIPHDWCVCGVCRVPKVDTSQRDDYPTREGHHEEESIMGRKNSFTGDVRKASLDLDEVKAYLKRTKWEIQVRWQGFFASLAGLVATVVLGSYDLIGEGATWALGLTAFVLTLVGGVSVGWMFCEQHSVSALKRDDYGRRQDRHNNTTMFTKVDTLKRLVREAQDEYNDLFQKKIDWDEAEQERRDAEAEEILRAKDA